VVDLDDPLHPRHAATIPLRDARASALQFRYLWVTDAEGLKLFDVTRMDSPRLIPSGDGAARRRAQNLCRPHLCLCRGEADGLVIVDITRPEAPSLPARTTFGGRMNDAEDVIVASTNASLFAYVADGRNGMKVLQLTSPESQPNFYGFSPAPKPELIAWAKTPRPGAGPVQGPRPRPRGRRDRRPDRRLRPPRRSRPFTRAEMERLFLNRRGLPFKVSDTGSRNG
jgi:hypothetical protein